MEEYYNFLMFELKDIEEEFDIPSQIAHEICLLLSIEKNFMPLPDQTHGVTSFVITSIELALSLALASSIAFRFILPPQSSQSRFSLGSLQGR